MKTLMIRNWKITLNVLNKLPNYISIKAEVWLAMKSYRKWKNSTSMGQTDIGLPPILARAGSLGFRRPGQVAGPRFVPRRSRSPPSPGIPCGPVDATGERQSMRSEPFGTDIWGKFIPLTLLKRP